MGLWCGEEGEAGVSWADEGLLLPEEMSKSWGEPVMFERSKVRKLWKRVLLKQERKAWVRQFSEVKMSWRKDMESFWTNGIEGFHAEVIQGMMVDI